MCGGERFASYRRDRERAGRMIALIARLDKRLWAHAGVSA
jgi:copper oxidase (laccase) domain-containing protein